LEGDSAALPALGAVQIGSRFKFRFVAHNEGGGGIVSNAQEMEIVFIKRANGQTAWFEAKPFVIAGFAQDKQGLVFDRFLS
jgi:hypothetical protein